MLSLIVFYLLRQVAERFPAISRSSGVDEWWETIRCSCRTFEGIWGVLNRRLLEWPELKPVFTARQREKPEIPFVGAILCKGVRASAPNDVRQGVRRNREGSIDRLAENIRSRRPTFFRFGTGVGKRKNGRAAVSRFLHVNAT